MAWPNCLRPRPDPLLNGETAVVETRAAGPLVVRRIGRVPKGRSSEQASEQNAIELAWAWVVTEVLLFGCVLCALTPETAEVKPRKRLK